MQDPFASGLVPSTGIYTPVFTAVLNVSNVIAYPTWFVRNGNIVSVWGAIDLTHTSTSTASRFLISLPIATPIASVYQLTGTAVLDCNTSYNGIQIFGNIATSGARADYFNGTGSGARVANFQFSYTVTP